MKKTLIGFLMIVFGFLIISASAAGAQARPVPCASLQTLRDITPGEHRVDGGTITVSQDQTELMIKSDTGGAVCQFEALNADGTTPSNGTFDGNNYTQKDQIDKIEFAFLPSSSDNSTNTPIVISASAFVGLSMLALILGTRQVMKL